MPPAGPFHPRLHLAAAALLLSTVLHAATAATSPEVAALMTFKSSLVIPPVADAFFSSWDTAAATPCNFTGVTCRGTAVTELSVHELNVSAVSVPFGVLCGSLKSLARLSLPSNALAGTIAGVDACVGLQELVLPFNSFSDPETDAAAGYDYTVDDQAFTAEEQDDGAQEMEYTGDDYYTTVGAYYYVEAAPDQQ